MPLTIDATVGGATANSYQSIAAVTAYALASAPTDAAVWAALSTDSARAPYVARAARVLDTIPFPGWLAASTQALQWPRYGVEMPSAGDACGDYPVDSIPLAVLNAHAALAVFLAVNAASDPFGGADAGPLSRLIAGPLELDFRDGAETAGRDYLEREIYPLLRAGNCAGSARSVRLTR